MSEQDKKVGELQKSLDRNRSKIRADRAEQIADDTRIEFRRSIEDIAREIRRLRSSRSALLDMSPDNSMSIISVKEFSAENFVREASSIAKAIFNKQQELKVLSEEYEFLFGEKPNLDF